ncbi:11961_t:CDS:10 [Diversispora eburnea]|uniref:11961_t:CDS:1 n=1 Tax=Diversispora eburnea TaxID=1213867 RepID=A0A9N8Z0D3_9GLOM|nr:11961_t:CDS:10 [Diversispora eburnea]
MSRNNSRNSFIPSNRGEFEYNLTNENNLSSTNKIRDSVSSSSEISNIYSIQTNSPTTPTSPNSLSPSSLRSSKQNFFSLFKKKDNTTVNNGSTNRLSAPPQQQVVPALNHYENNYHVSQSPIGSISVPDFTALNTNTNELDEEECCDTDTIMKEQASSSGNSSNGGSINNIHDGTNGNNITMKNTMRKTSTFFKKFGNKQNPDNNNNSSTHISRSPLPEFHDSQNLSPPSISTSTSNNPLSSPTSSSPNNTPNDLSIPAQFLVSTSFHDKFSDDIFTENNNDSDDGLYKLNTNKSVPDNIGRNRSLQSSKNSLLSTGLTRVKEEDEDNNSVNSKSRKSTINKNISNKSVNMSSDDYAQFADYPISFLKTPPASPSFVKGSLSRSDSKPSLHNSKSTTSLSTPRSSLLPEETNATPKRKPLLSKSSSHGSFKGRKEEREEIFDRRTLRVNVEQRGLFIKPTRPESTETGTGSGLSPSTIPKRPDKKLPDVPKTLSTSEADVSKSRSRSPHMRQASSIASSYYETASGSTTTLHTAPPSPIIDTFIESNSNHNLPEGTPKIQVDEVFSSESPIEDNNATDLLSPSSISEKMDDDDLAYLEAKNAARRCFEEDETFINKKTIAEFLGGTKPLNSRALKFYVDNFDFTNLRLDMAFRRLCGKLFLKAETQQVDRILEAFSIRYWECNPKCVFGSAVAYSILLLNTDLHVAQVSNKMSRAQFVRNTMSAVHTQITSITIQNNNNNDAYEDDQSTITSLETNTTIGASTTARPRRSSSIKSWRSNSNLSMANLSFWSRQWETELENLLKEIYNSIKANQILQPFSVEQDKSDTSNNLNNNNNLAPGLHRSLSHLGYQNARLNTLKKGIAAANAKARKNQNGRISPSPSFTSGGSDTSAGNDNQGRSGSFQTLQTLSSFSLRHASSCETAVTSTILYLSGAPYAKEGLLFRKHFWETTNKRAKDKGWKESFVVVEKGEIRMFKFESHSSHSSSGMGGAMGGGNWMSNATLLGEVNLRHTITNALPPPGYNRSRPNVFALSMSNGGLYFFQAGTSELVDEWVSTCNYWAARMSKEPLSGGVCNMEYGWGRCLEVLNDSNGDLEDVRSVRSDPRSISSSNSFYSSDRIVIAEWKTPIPPSVSSNHDEDAQLAALKKYKIDLESELEEHKNYWEPMSRLFPLRSHNHTKAFANWEKKSQWLLYEIVKYTTYIECIENSIKLRAKRKMEKNKSKETKETEIDEKENNKSEKRENMDKDQDSEEEKEQKREEQRARARLSLKLIQRSTWTPGDGCSLNLPKELLFDDEDGNGGEENRNSLIGLEAAFTAAKNRANKSKSATYPPASKVNEDDPIINNLEEKWV